MKRICPKCGKETEKLYNGLCYVCYKESTVNFEIKKKKIYICRHCKRVKIDNKWYDNFDINENYDIKYITCNTCKKFVSKGHNIILQIREIKDKEIINRIISFINNNKDAIKKTETNDEKVDFYIKTNDKNIKNYIKFLKNFGKLKITRKLKGYDKQKSKKKYIITILLFLNLNSKNY